MIQTKPKKCKGSGRADGWGCEDLTVFRKYGLCNDCYKQWLLNSDEGQELILKHTIKAKKENVLDRKAKNQIAKIDLMSCDQYRKKYIQPKINEIVRMIDYGQLCIATQKPPKKINAGHRTSVGSNRTIALNAHNIFLQSEHSNSYKGGDDTRYREGLILVFGERYNNFVESLKQHPPINLSKPYLIDLNKRLIDYKKTLEEFKRTNKERIQERNKLNDYLNIYEKKYSIYLE